MNGKCLFLVAVAVQQSHGGALYQALRVSRVGRKRTVEGRGRGKRFNFELFVLTSAGTAREPAAAAASLSWKLNTCSGRISAINAQLRFSLRSHCVGFQLTANTQGTGTKKTLP